MEFEFKDAFEYSSYNLSRVSLKENVHTPKEESKSDLIPLNQFYSVTKFEGVCSHYLFNSQVNDIFQVFIQASTFSLPATNVPVVMISSGAGLAPFKAFLQEGNEVIKSGKHKIDEFGEWWCIFGCRSVKIDYLYQEYLESSLISNGGCLKELKIAFSRDKEGKKVYVQDIIDQNSEKLWNLIHEQKGKVYVCGGVAMGKGVRAAFARVFDFYNKGKGHEYLDELLKKNQFVQELWG